MGRIQNTIAIPIYRVLPYPVIKNVKLMYGVGMKWGADLLLKNNYVIATAAVMD